MIASPVRLVGAAAAAFVTLSLVVIGHAGPLFSFDALVSGAAHTAALAHPLWRAAMAAVTATGSTTILGPLTAAGCAILLRFGRWRQAVFAATAMIVTLAARLVVLNLIARPRPADRLAASSGFSFPSGHSTASAAAALILVLICWPLLKQRWSRVLLCLGAGAWAFTVGLSRVALVVHWPSDVVGAWLFVLALVPAIGLALRHFLGRAESPRRGQAAGRPGAATGAEQLDGDRQD
ncbi:phosphatase PAP2 family protein [Actinoplanes sp. NPDC026619]|uniref:phosphatase PAP2 family protein n=1 Tax=Actinoplanes sp. NPDC026619 TaxID=3155798 RepID=UPI0033D65EAC